MLCAGTWTVSTKGWRHRLRRSGRTSAATARLKSSRAVRAFPATLQFVPPVVFNSVLTEAACHGGCPEAVRQWVAAGGRQVL